MKDKDAPSVADIVEAIEALRRRDVNELVEIIGMAGVGLNKADFMKHQPAIETELSYAISDLGGPPDDDGYVRARLLRVLALGFALGRPQAMAKAIAALERHRRILAEIPPAEDRVRARWPCQHVKVGLVRREVADTLGVSLRTVAKVVTKAALTTHRRG